MRLLVVSDLHANAGALALLEAVRADAVVFLGDAVDYGPDPARAVEWVAANADHAVRGNHDEAVARGTPTGASEKLAAVAEESATWTRGMLDVQARDRLGALPVTLRFTFAGTSFLALHAAPSDPLYRYLPPETTDESWERELALVDTDWLLFGHTHRPFVRRFARTTVLNPGSLGQPRNKVPHAAYAIWDDGDMFFAERRYDTEGVISRLAHVSLGNDGREQLVRVLRTGDL